MGQRHTLFDLAFGGDAEGRHGTPYLLMHRGDLHAALFSAEPADLIAFDRMLVGTNQDRDSLVLRFADGSWAGTDAVIGADGVHSKVCEILLGPEKPRFTGRIRAAPVFPSPLMQGYLVENCTKWWGPDRHIVIYRVDPRRDEIYFVSSVPDPTWDVESWSARGNMADVRRAFAGFHDDLQHVLAHCPSVHQWARSSAIHCCIGPMMRSRSSATPVVR